MEIIEKEKVKEVPADYFCDKYGRREEEGYGYNRRNINGKANAGVTLGIIGTALGAIALWGRRGIGGGGLLGGGATGGLGGGVSMPANVNINGVDAMNGYGNGSSRCAGPNAWEAWQKECEDTLALQKGMYDWALVQQSQRFQDRQTIDQEMFGLYKSQTDASFGLYKSTRDGFDILSAKQQEDTFRLYKGSRDQYDDLAKQISDLKAHVAVNDAVRPYQDKLIQCEINSVKAQAAVEDERIINLIYRLDCRNIKGINCLPNEPTVTGLPSNNPCCCSRVYGGTTTPDTPAQ